MSDVYAWIRDLFLMLLVLSFFQILIPDSSMEKYLKFIFSLVILAAILEPILNLVSNF
ncbi:MAG: stage III sporulation protein AF [Firmicutes bacterium]|nr:stage III sporulation protein AF [Bacillota bacterium]MDD7601961.1 stage III sporulation protein AF [Bacillota bacterium]MDY5855977.1 stage III sporulation protein AF [Anaerovoracaceae bacterium]